MTRRLVLGWLLPIAVLAMFAAIFAAGTGLYALALRTAAGP